MIGAWTHSQAITFPTTYILSFSVEISLSEGDFVCVSSKSLFLLTSFWWNLLSPPLPTFYTHRLEGLAALLQFGVYFSQRLLEVHEILCLLLKKCWNHKSMYGFIILLVEFYVLEELCIRDLDSVRCKVEGFMTVKLWWVFLKLLLGLSCCYYKCILKMRIPPINSDHQMCQGRIKFRSILKNGRNKLLLQSGNENQ